VGERDDLLHTSTPYTPQIMGITAIESKVANNSSQKFGHT